jgi:hypothetical protein
MPSCAPKYIAEAPSAVHHLRETRGQKWYYATIPANEAIGIQPGEFVDPDFRITIRVDVVCERKRVHPDRAAAERSCGSACHNAGEKLRSAHASHLGIAQ